MSFSFDHLIGERQQCWENSNPEVFSGLEVDRDSKLARLLNREIAGLGTAMTPEGGHRWGSILAEMRRSRCLIEVKDAAAQMMSTGMISGRLVAEELPSRFRCKIADAFGLSSTPRGVRSLF